MPWLLWKSSRCFLSHRSQLRKGHSLSLSSLSSLDAFGVSISCWSSRCLKSHMTPRYVMECSASKSLNCPNSTAVYHSLRLCLTFKHLFYYIFLHYKRDDELNVSGETWTCLNGLKRINCTALQHLFDSTFQFSPMSSVLLENWKSFENLFSQSLNRACVWLPLTSVRVRLGCDGESVEHAVNACPVCVCFERHSRRQHRIIRQTRNQAFTDHSAAAAAAAANDRPASLTWHRYAERTLVHW